MKRGNTNSIPSLLIDNHVLSRMLDRGTNSSLARLEGELQRVFGRTIRAHETQIIFGPSSVFEFAGLGRDEFVRPEELRDILASIDPKLSPPKFIESLFRAIEVKVEALDSLTPESFIKKFEDKLPHLPKDSQDFVKTYFIKPLRVHPQKMKEIRRDLAFHLLCSCAVPQKHVNAQHILGIRLTFAHFKTGNITSVAKHLSRVWQRMRPAEELEAMSTAHKDALAGQIAMHGTRDYLDSDLVHLAVMGYVRGGVPKPVYCITEDGADQVTHRVLLYKSLTRALAQSYREKDERPGEREYKDLDFKHGRVVFVDENMRILDELNVQKLKKARIFTADELALLEAVRDTRGTAEAIEDSGWS